MNDEIKQDGAKIKSLETEFTYIRHLSPEMACSSARSPNDFFNNVKIFVGELLKKYHFTHDISEADKEGYYNVIYI